MDVALGFAVFWPALALGSFLNVVAARVPLRRSIVRPASACMSCGHELAWYENVPVASWLWLRGHCRSCHASISARYPAVELATAVLVAGCFVEFGLSGEAFLAAFFCVVLVVLSAIDLEHRIVPNRIVVPAAAFVLLAHTALDPSPAWALGALGASGFLFVAALAYPAGMGMGDVKLALLLGAMLGKLVGVGLMVGMVAALVPSVVLLARHGSAARKMGIPFAPFLALGALVALFWGQPLLDAYLGRF
ncbi:MAG TPA: prepilin peptidase [Gaiellaceae bacterium]|nr:prepilin peptidase [Gaiellaceae bacterium]